MPGSSDAAIARSLNASDHRRRSPTGAPSSRSARTSMNWFGLVLRIGVDIDVDIHVRPLSPERLAPPERSRLRAYTLGGERRIETLKDLVATVADADLRTKIEGEVSALAEQSRRLAEQESTLSQAQAEQIAKRDEALAKLRAEIFERRLKAWTNFFAKESVATYIGAFLLIVVMLVQIIAMFTGDKYKSEIINNAFLLLLGYFFGQGGARAAVEQTKSGGG